MSELFNYSLNDYELSKKQIINELKDKSLAEFDEIYKYLCKKEKEKTYGSYFIKINEKTKIGVVLHHPFRYIDFMLDDLDLEEFNIILQKMKARSTFEIDKIPNSLKYSINEYKLAKEQLVDKIKSKNLTELIAILEWLRKEYSLPIYKYKLSTKIRISELSWLYKEGISIILSSLTLKDFNIFREKIQNPDSFNNKL